MSLDAVDGALGYLSGLDVQDVPMHAPASLVAQPPRFVPKADQEQAVVVGSHLQTFAGDVDVSLRPALQDAMLLAQLAAKKQADGDDVHAWYDVYFEVLSNIGLQVQERAFTSSDTGTTQADVEKVVLELAASLLGGPATTGYRLVAAAVSALLTLDADNRALTIFRRETYEESGRFQLSVAQQGDAGLEVALMAFTFDISKTSTKVLVFSWKSEAAHVRHAAGTLAANEAMLRRIAADLSAKVGAHVEGYVRQIQI